MFRADVLPEQRIPKRQLAWGWVLYAEPEVGSERYLLVALPIWWRLCFRFSTKRELCRLVLLWRDSDGLTLWWRAKDGSTR
jgi:hypothetical protein